jgi:hypothetical protein
MVVTKPRIKCLGVAESPAGKQRMAWACLGEGAAGRGWSPVEAHWKWLDNYVTANRVKNQLTALRPFGVARG